MEKMGPFSFRRIVFITGVGMSRERGPRRGMGGVWKSYRYEKYACQEAFDSPPDDPGLYDRIVRARASEALDDLLVFGES